MSRTTDIPRLLVVIAALGGATTSASAQGVELHPRSPVLFLDKTYFFPLAPYQRNLLFEGEAAGHYFIFNRFDWSWTRTGGWRYALPLSMVFSVRMSTDESQPVRTPSYRIGVRPQLLKGWPEGADASRFKVAGFSAGFTHYSNGQAGCTYLGSARPAPNAACAITSPSLAAQRRANTIDGDFSTSYVMVAAHALRGRHYGIRGPVRTQDIVTLELQLHPFGMQPGGMNKEQAAEYGWHQVQGSYEHERRFRLARKSRGLGRLGLKGGYRMPYDGGRSGRFLTIETSYLFDCLQKFGGVVRWHLGNDYYNINFQDTRPLLAVGLMWDPGRIDAFNRRGPRNATGAAPRTYTCKGD